MRNPFYLISNLFIILLVFNLKQLTQSQQVQQPADFLKKEHSFSKPYGGKLQ